MQLSSQVRYDTSGISNLVRIEELVIRNLSPGRRWIRRDSWSSPSERKVCWNTSPVILFSGVVITMDPVSSMFVRASSKCSRRPN